MWTMRNVRQLASLFLLPLGVVVWLGPVEAKEAEHDEHLSPYVGQEERAIKSLSEQDIDDLRNGEGWELAKAAELNGIPGPAHVLELEKEMLLTSEQKMAIDDISEKMSHDAKAEGRILLSLEQELDDSFRDLSITQETLPPLVAKAAASRGKLRSIHLLAHLLTLDVLTPDQIRRYNLERGYHHAS